jgi:hypothetical protein
VDDVNGPNTMLAIQNPGDWIEIVVVVLIVAGSALSGIVKTITAKLNRSQEVEAERAPGTTFSAADDGQPRNTTRCPSHAAARPATFEHGRWPDP